MTDTSVKMTPEAMEKLAAYARAAGLRNTMVEGTSVSGVAFLVLTGDEGVTRERIVVLFDPLGNPHFHWKRPGNRPLALFIEEDEAVAVGAGEGGGS